jgi:beta-N-acetylhexosaminidase
MRCARRPLPIAIDHEGGGCSAAGRVSRACRRCVASASVGPAARCGARAARGDRLRPGRRTARLRRRLSFTPVLDLDWGRSSVIGDRSFHGDPAGGHRTGRRADRRPAQRRHGRLRQAFPGAWLGRSRLACRPAGGRAPFAELAPDLEPYRRLKLDAVMPAHVIYRLDGRAVRPASRASGSTAAGELGFAGVIFSDDLSMAGASVAGGIVERCTAAWEAGCDLLLVCNSPDAVGELLADWRPLLDPRAPSGSSVCHFPSTRLSTGTNLQEDANYLAGVAAATRLLAELASRLSRAGSSILRQAENPRSAVRPRSARATAAEPRISPGGCRSTSGRGSGIRCCGYRFRSGRPFR